MTDIPKKKHSLNIQKSEEVFINDLKELLAAKNTDGSKKFDQKSILLQDVLG